MIAKKHMVINMDTSANEISRFSNMRFEQAGVILPGFTAALTTVIYNINIQPDITVLSLAAMIFTPSTILSVTIHSL